MELLKKKISVTKNIKENLAVHIEKYKTIILLSVVSFFIGRLDILSGISPFSLSFLLAAEKNPLIFLSVISGIMSNSLLNSEKYILITLFGTTLSLLIKWILPKADDDKINPAVIFISSFTFSLCFTLFKDYVIYDILFVLFESVISFLSYFILKKGIKAVTTIFKKKFFTSEEIVTFLTILTIFIAGIGNITIFNNINIKNICAVFFVLLGASTSNTGISSQIASFMGIAAGCGSDYMGIFIATYCVNGLMGSVFSKYGKLITILGFTAGNVIMNILMGYEYYMVISYTEITLASTLYIIFPDILFKRIFSHITEVSGISDYPSSIKEISITKLDSLSSALKKLSDTISDIFLRKDAVVYDDISDISENVSDKVCKKCDFRFKCWQKDSDETRNTMIKLIKKIKTKGILKLEDFPENFRNKCVKSNEVLQVLTSSYELYRVNTLWKKKIKDNTKIYKEQFDELSDIVLNLKGEIEKNPYFDRQLSLDISSALENDGINVKNIRVIKDSNENTGVELTLYPCQKKDKCYKFIEERLSEILGIPFIKTSGKCSFKECVLNFKENYIYTLSSSVKQHSKNENKVCGDNYSLKTLENSSSYVILCDGSGSGDTASLYSGNTVKLLEEFLRTGFSKSTSVKLINSSLMFNRENDYFSTIDLSIFNLKSGELEILKKGACPTYIKKSNGEYLVIEKDSLPIGIIDEEECVTDIVKLRENDIIVMVSDGIYSAIEKEGWIIEALKAIKSDDPEIIADTLLKIATSTKNKDKDDMTVIVNRLSSLKNDV